VETNRHPNGSKITPRCGIPNTPLIRLSKQNVLGRIIGSPIHFRKGELDPFKKGEPDPL
jgi:hypothetical protein